MAFNESLESLPVSLGWRLLLKDKPGTGQIPNIKQIQDVCAHGAHGGGKALACLFGSIAALRRVVPEFGIPSG